MVSIRPVIPSDARVVADLREAMFVDIGWVEGTRHDVVDATVDYFERTIADGTYIGYLAEEGGVAVGTVGAVVVIVPPYGEDLLGRIPRVQNVYVLPGHRRRGIARQLMRTLLEELRAQGLRRVSLMATEYGKPLYEEFGFEDVPEMSVLLDPPSDAEVERDAEVEQ
jgi:GNAT superfamily N-acetyltransferase